MNESRKQISGRPNDPKNGPRMPTPRPANRTDDPAPPQTWKHVYAVVDGIPSGFVATYGQIAALSGMPGAARQVGWALAALGADDDSPWHRVINAKGEVSPRATPEIEDLQRALLESEGVNFDERGRVDLGRHGWRPGSRTHRRSNSSAAKATRAAGSTDKVRIAKSGKIGARR